MNHTPYRVHLRVRDVIDRCVEQLAEDNVVEKCSSQRGSLETILTKPDGSPRFRADYRKTINAHLERERSPMPDVTARIDAIQGMTFMFVFGIQHAHHQIPIAS